MIVASPVTVERPKSLGRQMLKWALVFFIISVVAGLLGFTGIAAGAAEISKILFVIFLILCAIFLVLGLIAAKALK
jgi:uncharacterized membrane protein YtjA (UPF0391 family)